MGLGAEVRVGLTYHHYQRPSRGLCASSTVHSGLCRVRGLEPQKGHTFHRDRASST